MTAGPVIPDHRRGHCGFDPTLDGQNLCATPAEVHVLVDDGEHERFGVFACTRHRAPLASMVDAIDLHEVGPGCLAPNAAWHHARPSFCESPEDEAELAALTTREPAEAAR